MGADAEAEAAAAITAAVTTSSVRRRPTKLEKAAWQTWRCDCAASAAAALASRADAALLQHSRVGDPSRSAGRHSLVPSAAASSSPHPPPKPALAALFFRSLSPSQTTKVVIHPIVLLSVVDHYNRVAKDTKKRVVGMLLGQVSKGVVDVLNVTPGCLRKTSATSRSGSSTTITTSKCTPCTAGEREREADRVVLDRAEDPARICRSTSSRGATCPIPSWSSST